MANVNKCPWGVGAKTSTLIVPEVEYGVTPAAPGASAIRLPFNSNSVAASQNSTSPSTIRGNRSPVEPIFGNKDLGGSIVAPVDYVAIGYWLKMAFGAPETTAVSGGHQHVYKINNAQPSFSMEKMFPGISKYIVASGCKISKLSITVGGDGELTASIDVMGAKETVNGSSLSATPTEARFVRASNFDAALKIGGAEAARITSFSIEIDFGLDGDSYSIGKHGYREAICEGICSVTGTMEAFFADSTYLDMAESSTETSAELILTQDTKSLSFKMPEIKFALTSPSIDGPSGVKQSLNYSAYYDDSAEASAVVVTLVNDMTAY